MDAEWHGMDTVRDAFLLTFGNGSNGVKADTIFRELTARNVWYLPKAPVQVVSGSPLLFYQSGLGARGTASFASAEPLSDEDEPIFAQLGLAGMKIRLTTRDVREFARPVALPLLIADLQFIGNKAHWGLYLRNTPRRIPIADYNLILSRAPK